MNTISILKEVYEQLRSLPFTPDILRQDENPELIPMVLLKIASNCGSHLDRVVSILQRLISIDNFDTQSAVFAKSSKALADDLHARSIGFISQALNESAKTNSNIVQHSWNDDTWQSKAADLCALAEQLEERCRVPELEMRIRDLEHFRGPGYADGLVALVESAKKTGVALEKAKMNLEKMLNLAAASEEQLGRTKLVQGAIAELERLTAKHRFWSIIWIALAGLGGFVTLYLLIWVFSENQKLFVECGPVFKVHSSEPGGMGFLANSISRLVVLSVGASITLLALRMYQTHMHNMVTNEHRRMSLTLFEYLQDALVGKNETNESRHLLLIHAAQSILQHANSGFLPTKGEDILPALQIFSDLAKVPKPQN